VTPVAVYLAFRDHVAAGGTSCGAALFPTGSEGDGVDSVCSQLIADAQPLALAVGALALVLVMTSITTLIVRGWVAREASTPD
jgi:hypothetical protein